MSCSEYVRLTLCLCVGESSSLRTADAPMPHSENAKREGEKRKKELS